MVDGREVDVARAYAGAEGRYEDYVLLQMLEREWKRPLTEADLPHGPGRTDGPAARAVIVVMFWTYFETKIERLLRACLREVPLRIAEDLLSRYASVTARVDRLYKILFETTYWRDLEDAGFSGVSTLLQQVRDGRNRFTHGTPSAISEDLVTAVVASLKQEHESWIAVYNRRATQAQQW